MTMTSAAAVARITRQMIDVETSVDLLLAQTSSLFATVAQARIDVEAPLADAQPTLLRLAKMQNALMTVRSDVIRAHGDMLKVGEARGDMVDGPCPSNSELKASREQSMAA